MMRREWAVLARVSLRGDGPQRRSGERGAPFAGDGDRGYGLPAAGRHPAGTKRCSTRPRSDRRDYEVTERPRFTDLP